MSSLHDTPASDLPVADVALRYAGAIAVFERLGIDYCCGGSRPLGDVVAEKGLDWTEVVTQIETATHAPSPEAGLPSWSDAPLTDLMGFIVSRYHARLRDDLPRLTVMGEKVVNAHGERHPDVRQIASVYASLRAELESHMMKEEHVLFPFIEQLEAGLGSRHPMLGHVASPIGVMEAEHDRAGQALASLRAMTAGYVTPPDGCATFRGWYDGLATLEQELHAHIHLENNILFPRAQALEASVLARS